MIKEEKLQVPQGYRRLRILLNRLNAITNRPCWNCVAWYRFPTQLGERKIGITKTNQPVDTIVLYYVDDVQVLFQIRVTRQGCFYLPYVIGNNYVITEEQAWLAIYELEQLLYEKLQGKDKGKLNDQ